LRDLTAANFGLIVAYVLPGFTALWGISHFSETVRVWLGSSQGNWHTVGGFLYVTLASIGTGMTVSTVRWMVIDTLHALTGIRQPRWDFSKLQENAAGYDILVKIHYHFYQFNANMLVSVLFLYIARCIFLGWSSFLTPWDDLGFVAVGLVFFVGSRDTLRKYHTRVARLLGTEAEQQHSDSDPGVVVRQRHLSHQPPNPPRIKKVVAALVQDAIFYFRLVYIRLFTVTYFTVPISKESCHDEWRKQEDRFAEALIDEGPRERARPQAVRY